MAKSSKSSIIKKRILTIINVLTFISYKKTNNKAMFTGTQIQRGITIFLNKPTQYAKPILLLLGAPGVGKATFGNQLSKEWSAPMFSTGEFLRDILKHEASDRGDRIRAMVQRGKLVEDETVYKIIEHRLLYDEDKNAKGVILDGYPRTLNQAIMLDKLGTVRAAMNFILSDDVIIEKLAGRRICEECYATYNVASIHRDGNDIDPILPKKDPTMCDLCGGDLVRRHDDEPTIINDKLEVYRANSIPIEKYYKEKGVYVECEPKRGIKDYQKIKAKLDKFLKSTRK